MRIFLGIVMVSVTIADPVDVSVWVMLIGAFLISWGAHALAGR
jgi:hypothetical protein